MFLIQIILRGLFLQFRWCQNILQKKTLFMSGYYSKITNIAF